MNHHIKNLLCFGAEYVGEIDRSESEPIIRRRNNQCNVIQENVMQSAMARYRWKSLLSSSCTLRASETIRKNSTEVFIP